MNNPSNLSRLERNRNNIIKAVFVYFILWASWEYWKSTNSENRYGKGKPHYHKTLKRPSNVLGLWLDPSTIVEEPKGGCITKKIIIVDVNKCGLGNRMVSLVSAVMMGLMMDRVVQVDWVANHFCGSSYTDIFQAKQQESLAHGYRPFLFNGSTYGVPNIVKRNQTVCRIFFDQNLNYTHLSFLGERALFDRLDAGCHVIHIQSNIYFGKILATNQLGMDFFQDKLHLYSPFHHFAEIAFQPHSNIKALADAFITDKFKGEKWLSIHARGYYDDGTHTGRALDCANKLLEDGEISYVFFSSEAQRLIDKAKKRIPGKNLVMVEHETVSDEAQSRVDSWAIRNPTGMSYAILEWLILGEATYCTASEIEKSTFSKTAIARGPCGFIQFSGELCKVDDPMYKSKKEQLMKNGAKKAILNNAPPVPDPVEQEKIWKTVRITNEDIYEQCFDEPWVSTPYLYRYWGIREKKSVEVQQNSSIDSNPLSTANMSAATNVQQMQAKITRTNSELDANPGLLNDQLDQNPSLAEIERRRCSSGHCKPGYIVGSVGAPEESRADARKSARPSVTSKQDNKVAMDPELLESGMFNNIQTEKKLFGDRKSNKETKDSDILSSDANVNLRRSKEAFEIETLLQEPVSTRKKTRTSRTRTRKSGETSLKQKKQKNDKAE